MTPLLSPTQALKLQKAFVNYRPNPETFINLIMRQLRGFQTWVSRRRRRCRRRQRSLPAEPFRRFQALLEFLEKKKKDFLSHWQLEQVFMLCPRKELIDWHPEELFLLH